MFSYVYFLNKPISLLYFWLSAVDPFHVMSWFVDTKSTHGSHVCFFMLQPWTCNNGHIEVFHMKSRVLDCHFQLGTDARKIIYSTRALHDVGNSCDEMNVWRANVEQPKRRATTWRWWNTLYGMLHSHQWHNCLSPHSFPQIWWRLLRSH